jgi:hypothetical protein
LRLRAAMWRQWKTPRRRRAALLELGVREPLASNTAGSGRGPWYLAKAKALAVGLSNRYFKSLARISHRGLWERRFPLAEVSSWGGLDPDGIKRCPHSAWKLG